MAVELAARLRAETHALHKQVESSTFMAELLGGRLTRSAYALMLRNLEPIYFELEAGFLRHAAHPGVRPLFQAPLFRLRALHQDLETLHGDSWRDEVKLLDGSIAYVARLRHLTEFQPELLAAHAYVRYLGDLSGGQMLSGIVARSLGLSANDGPNWGTDFYNFGDADTVLGLAQAFRSGLAMLTADGIAAEARLAFEMHFQLFEDLSNCCGLRSAAVTPFD